MKWLCLLLLALVVTTFGIMFTEDTAQYVFQIAFFCTLGVGVLVFSTGILG